MKILLIGYGKMGKAIERIAVERGHDIAGRWDVGSNTEFPKADVAIEFTQPEAAPANLRRCIDAHLPVVCGTTGWQSQKEEVERYCRDHDGTLFYASNFSLGVNIFFRLNEMLARMMAHHPEYIPGLEEIHHIEKKDAPSGTAITLAEGILRNLPRKKRWTLKAGDDPAALPITAIRKDAAPGTHVVTYRSTVDELELRHTAHSREGFARGAVLVAEWLPGKKGVFGMDDFLKF
jgi:4-hydroxy-tetrahydrodipicolinate reductase